MRLPSLSAANRRLSLVTVDQAMSSASNLMVLIWMAHALAPVDFGRFTLIFFVYVFAIGPVQALVCWPVLVHPEDADEKPRGVLGAAVLLAGMVAALCLVAGLALGAAGSALAPSMLVLAAMIALMVVQDAGRFLAFAQGRPIRAVVLDSAWLLLMIASFVAIGVAGVGGPTTYLLGWAGAGALAGLWVFVQYGVPRSDEWSFAWLRERWDFSWRSLVSNSSGSTVALVGSWLMTLVSGPIAVAAVRAALLLERPSTMVQVAAATSTAADVARESWSKASVLRHQRRVMVIAGTVSVVNLLVLLFLPDVLGRAVLGQMWPIVQPLLLAVALRVMAMAALSGVRAVLLGRRQIQTVMVIDIVAAVGTISSLVVGAMLAGASGAVWGACVGQALAAVAWWTAFLRYLRRGEEPQADPDADALEAPTPGPAAS